MKKNPFEPTRVVKFVCKKGNLIGQEQNLLFSCGLNCLGQLWQVDKCSRLLQVFLPGLFTVHLNSLIPPTHNNHETHCIQLHVIVNSEANLECYTTKYICTFTCKILMNVCLWKRCKKQFCVQYSTIYIIRKSSY